MSTGELSARNKETPNLGNIGTQTSPEKNMGSKVKLFNKSGKSVIYACECYVNLGQKVEMFKEQKKKCSFHFVQRIDNLLKQHHTYTEQITYRK